MSGKLLLELCLTANKMMKLFSQMVENKHFLIVSNHYGAVKVSEENRN